MEGDSDKWQFVRHSLFASTHCLWSDLKKKILPEDKPEQNHIQLSQTWGKVLSRFMKPGCVHMNKWIPDMHRMSLSIRTCHSLWPAVCVIEKLVWVTVELQRWLTSVLELRCSGRTVPHFQLFQTSEFWWLLLSAQQTDRISGQVCT